MFPNLEAILKLEDLHASMTEREISTLQAAIELKATTMVSKAGCHSDSIRLYASTPGIITMAWDTSLAASCVIIRVTSMMYLIKCSVCAVWMVRVCSCCQL